MTSEGDDRKARNRIREAKRTGAVALDLGGLALTRVPPELAQLTALRFLSMADCRELAGDLAPIAGLNSLEMLNLSGCEDLAADLSPLSHLTSLKQLAIAGCVSLTADIAFLRNLNSLEALDLSGGWQLTGNLSMLTNCTSLQSLDLSGCEKLQGDLSSLAGMTSLEWLSLAEASELVGDLSAITKLTSLRLLDATNCGKLKGELSKLGQLPLLEVLILSHCDQLTGSLSDLSGLTTLVEINISEFKGLSGDLNDLAGLTALQALNLSGCKSLTGNLSSVTSLQSLRFLDLSSCEQLTGNLDPLAELQALESIKLFWCMHLTGDLRPLSNLRSLKVLDLSGCQGLKGDLSPLSGLISIETLNLFFCVFLNGDLSPLANLKSLRSLDLGCCVGFSSFGPMEPLLSSLDELCLFDSMFQDLPREVCGEYTKHNVIDLVSAHFKDLKSGRRKDAEVKILLLGNGGVGKTQLCRRLCGLKFDPTLPTTHGVQLGETTLTLADFPEVVRLNFWDFGGQDIYHGSHALFVQSHGIFLLLWTPPSQGKTECQEGEMTFRPLPLVYWLDYLQAFAGRDAFLLVLQSQCDTRSKRLPSPSISMDDFPLHRCLEVSARTDLNIGVLKETIREAVRDRFERFPPPPLGLVRLKVRQRLREILAEDQQREPHMRQHRLLERKEFDALCAEIGDVQDTDALLDFLHRNGVLFYKPAFLDNRIILDLNWALEAIYALFDREKILPLLRGYGRFTQKDLAVLIWGGYTPGEQLAFLSMMESCGVCFEARRLPDFKSEYIAPELLPEWSEAQELLFGRLRNDTPDAAVTARYLFLHEGILRCFLSKLGEHAKDAAVYWKYGCWFYEEKTASQVLIESSWDNGSAQSGAGAIRLRAWGSRADKLLQSILQPLQELNIGPKPDIRPTDLSGLEPNVYSPDALQNPRENLGLKELDIPARPQVRSRSKPEIFVSYAWGDSSSEIGRQRGAIVDRLCETLEKDEWVILRDQKAILPAELISGFLKRIGQADHVIVVLSDKYLRSPYCMTELHQIYQRSIRDKEEFLSRIVPLTLEDARIASWQDRVAYAEYWTSQFNALDAQFADKEKRRLLGTGDWIEYKEIDQWRSHISDILRYVNDLLAPRGFENIVRADFAELRRILAQRRV